MALLILAARRGDQVTVGADAERFMEGLLARPGGQIEEVRLSRAVASGLPDMAEYDEIVENGTEQRRAAGRLRPRHRGDPSPPS